MAGPARHDAVDWAAVDEEVQSVPPEYREFKFYPLKHVVEVFSAADPQALTQELRDAEQRLGAQLDAVVEAYHTGFAKSIQNYSEILRLFHESKEQVELLKRSLADGATQLGAHSKFMNQQWRQTLSLDSSLGLLADIAAVVEVPALVDAALAAKDWPAAVSALLDGATRLSHHELQRVGALRKIRSDFSALSSWIQEQMMDELQARIFSGAFASSSLAPASAAMAPSRARVAGGLGGRGPGGAGAGLAALGQQGPAVRFAKRTQVPAYKLVTETLQQARTTSTDLQTALGAQGLDAAAGLGPGRPPLEGADATVAADVDAAMRHVSTRELVACLAQVGGVAEAKGHLARQAKAQVRRLIHLGVEQFVESLGDADGLMRPGGGAVAGGLAQSQAAADAVTPQALSSRLLEHVCATCIKALLHMQHVLVELANAPGTPSSSALDLLKGAAAGGGLLGTARAARDREHRGGPKGGGLTAKERAAFLREEFQRAWDEVQAEVLMLLSELLQAPPKRPIAAYSSASGAAGAGGLQDGSGPDGASRDGGGGEGGGRPWLQLAVLNPVHFLEQLATLAEKTADLAEVALGGAAEKAAASAAAAKPPANGRGLAGQAGPGAAAHPAGGSPGASGAAAGEAGPVASARQRRKDMGKLSFHLDVTIPGVSMGAAAAGMRMPRDAEAAGYSAIVRKALGDQPGSLHLLPHVYLPASLFAQRAAQTLRMPDGLASQQQQPAAGASAVAGAVVSSWLPRYLEEVVLEQFLPLVWVELRGRVTAALEEPEAFRPQSGMGGAAAAAGGSSSMQQQPLSLAAGAGVNARALLPIARFGQGVLGELVGWAHAIPAFDVAFFALAERILERLLMAFTDVVWQAAGSCQAARLAARSDVCLAMASETDALLLRDAIAFVPHPVGSTQSPDLVGFLLAVRGQERPALVPQHLRPAGAAARTSGLAGEGDAAEMEVQYCAFKERPVGTEQLLMGAGTSDRAVMLAAVGESLDYVASCVVSITSAAEGGVHAAHGAAHGAAGRGHGSRRHAHARAGRAGGAGAGAASTQEDDVPEVLMPILQRYKALAGHCARLLRLELLLLLGHHLHPLVAASHLCEEEDAQEMHPCIGSVTRVVVRASEELVPLLSPAKAAYVFGPLAAAAARMLVWVLPALHEINALGVERMVRTFSVLQPVLGSLVAANSMASTSPALAAGAGDDTAAATAAADGSMTAAMRALLVQPESRGERGRAYDRARSYYGMLLVPADEVVRLATERPGRFLYAEWVWLLAARVPGRTVTDVSQQQLQRALDKAYGLTAGQKVAGALGSVVSAVQAPAERLGDALKDTLLAGKDVLLAGKDTLVAGVRVPAQTLQRVFKKIAAKRGAKSGDDV